MNIGIIYYSRTGNTKKIAGYIEQAVKKKNHQTECIEVIPDKQPGYLNAVFSSIRQKKIPITNEPVDVAVYDHVFIGCPIWGRKPAPVIKTIIQQSKGFEKTMTSVFITCGGLETPESTSIQLLKSYLREKQANIFDDTLIVYMQGNEKIREEIPSVEDYVSTVLTS